MTDYSDKIRIKPLPTTIYMMQMDLINHYEYAINHYFDISLDEHYLQNSSLGTPYQKWMKFNNDQFRDVHEKAIL